MYFKYTNMIAKNEIFPIGRLLKTHGLSGEMTFSTTTTLLDEIEIPYLILEPEGIAVPLFIEEVRMKSGETGLIKFEGIDSGEQAREYVGLTLYLPNEYLEEMDETDEEAGADITLGPLFSLVNVPHVGQVHLFYLAQLNSDQFHPGWETMEAKLFTESDIPWDDIAFRTVKVTLERYFEDHKKSAFGIHVVDLEAPKPAS